MLQIWQHRRLSRIYQHLPNAGRLLVNHDIGASTVQTETMQEGNLLLDEVCNFPPYIDEYLQNRKNNVFFCILYALY